MILLFSQTSLIITAVIVFLSLTLLLVWLILFLKKKLTPGGLATIDINGERQLEVESGSTLLSTLGNNGIFLPSACGGGGSCGMCKCKVTDGGGEILPTETGFLSRKQQQEKWRLACQIKVKEDMKVEVPEEVLGIKKWECEVVSNRNVATFIKEFVVKLPTGIAFRNQMNLIINKEKLLLYNVSYDELTRVLRTAFKENKVSVLRSYQQYLPISIAGEEKSVNSVLSETLVRTMADGNGEVNHIPLNNLVTVVPAEDLKSITAGKNGEYIPLSFYDVKDAPELMRNVKEVVSEEKEWEVDFSGSFFSNEKMMGELTVILFVSLLLMYFILCAQFESFLQPLIVLMEIPIDTAFALLALWVFGHTLNLMSAIGIIVTCGIVVNDSILKMDAINELRKAGMPLVEAIHTAGRRRLRAIIMTSLTTVFAMVPLLFTSDMGSEMQKPLSIAMIGSMVVGTLVSLFIIPLIYWFIYRKHDKNEVH